MAAGLECQFCNRVISRSLLGKAVFSGTLEEGTQLACVVSAAWESGGVISFQGGKKKNKKQKIQTKTPSQPVKSKKKNKPKRLYISTNYCLLTRDQSKTFVLTQIHKCRRSVNRIYKGYLLVIYMKR